MIKKDIKQICENPEDLQVPILRLYRATSIIFVKMLVNTNVTANQITYLGFFCYILSAYFFSVGNYTSLLIALVFLQIGYVCDYIDGALARLQGNSTKFGHWLDLLSGTYGGPLIFLGITLGVYKQIQEPHVLWLGFLAAISPLLKNVTQSYYTSIFKSTKDLRKKAYKKLGNLLISLRYTHYLIIPILTIGSLLNKMYFVLIFCGVYGPLYTIVQTAFLTFRAKREYLKIQKK